MQYLQNNITPSQPQRVDGRRRGGRGEGRGEGRGKEERGRKGEGDSVARWCGETVSVVNTKQCVNTVIMAM